MLHRLAGGGLAAGLHLALDLPVHHGKAAQYRQHADDPGQQVAPAQVGAAFGGKRHAGMICVKGNERIAACRDTRPTKTRQTFLRNVESIYEYNNKVLQYRRIKPAENGSI
ncbi:hypothetical protein D3C79_919440 [compost metagenome]